MLDFISQPSSKSLLPFAGLQHMQQCQVNFQPIFAPGFWSKWMVPENGLLSGGLYPRPLSHESSALTPRPRLLAGFHSALHLWNWFVSLVLIKTREYIEKKLNWVRINLVSGRTVKFAFTLVVSEQSNNCVLWTYLLRYFSSYITINQIRLRKFQESTRSSWNDSIKLYHH